MSLHALSPLDGRYADQTSPLREFFSDFAYLRARTRLELEYLAALLGHGVFPSQPTSAATLALDDFGEDDARKIQEYEKDTRHDVKAIEHYLRDRLPPELHPYLHFGLTSEDINNIAQALALRDSRDRVMLPALDELLASLREFARRHRALPFLARTHGQPAVPTTLGKEFAVHLLRLQKCRDEMADHIFEAKLSGAAGSFNAWYAAFPEVDWIDFSKAFIARLGLAPNLLTTQILPYDNWIRYFGSIHLTNTVLLDYAQDVWRYVSDGVLKQKAVEGEVGSSTMPQKVNPIDFENAEGNLGIANALLAHYSAKLPVSRLQRDLSDSTVRRTFGAALGHTLLAWKNITRGMARIDADEVSIQQDLDEHWEVIGEGAQTILRAAGRADAYELLKSQTRGRRLDENSYRGWVESLEVEPETRARLLGLSPRTYTGLAARLVDEVIR